MLTPNLPLIKISFCFKISVGVSIAPPAEFA